MTTATITGRMVDGTEKPVLIAVGAAPGAVHVVLPRDCVEIVMNTEAAHRFLAELVKAIEATDAEDV